MHLQLELHIAEAMEALSVDDRTLAAELGVNLPHLQRLRDDRWTEISRTNLQALLCWGRKHNRNLFSLTASPLWRTFREAPVVILRGRDDKGNPLPSDSDVEGVLIDALKEEACQVDIRNGDEHEYETIVRLVQTNNCIFVGSPKHNLATENVLAALWNLKPADDSALNRAKAPFGFVWEAAPRRPSAFAITKRPADPVGICVNIKGARKTPNGHHLKVDWRTPDDYSRWSGKGKDAGVLVVCNRPLSTELDVTTLVLAGHSGFATQDMARDFVGDVLRIASRDVAAGQPVMRLLAARYKKVGGRNSPRVPVSKGRRWFGPPWLELKSIKH
jgi:hypothetical protein